MSSDSMIELSDLTKEYAGRAVVANLDLAVRKGELLVLVGPSGCGKTTTLSMINRLVEPTQGEIRIDGRSVREQDPVKLRRGIGFVFQDIGLFPHLTAAENVGITLKLNGVPGGQAATRVSEVMDLVRMPQREFGARKPAELSGGQRQRIGIARALAASPSIMLMDEPFGALDPLTRDELVGDFRALHNVLQLTTMLVTHDMTEAILTADRIAILRKGRLIQIGTPHEIVSDPVDEFVRSLIESPRKRARALAQALELSPDGTSR